MNIHTDGKSLYHPAFNSPDADVTLTSSEGTLYRVPSFTLRTTSGTFRKLLSPPRGIDNPLDNPILVPEKNLTLEIALRMISGLELPKWHSFDELEDVLVLVEKWEAQGPISVIRSAVTAPMFLSEPLRLYALATRLGWEMEAKLASTCTLALSLYDEQHQPPLYRMSSKALLALLALHRSRRDEFQRLVDSDERFNVGNTENFLCPACSEPMDNHSWRELKAKMFMEMDQRPLGDTLTGLEMEEWPEGIACWNARCPTAGCGRLYYNKLSTLREIKDCIDRLPTTV
ncbi:hypothetical protein BDN72DRAFT_768584 [Pluteus cervinus]|uniref:Uncharacterized protein n=1 Tax=Pluteus cervinus TaxID=181527 RepID=A0ACD3ASI4_9AGAR|nr:hypothetical protein BDN72DRAFT_768584 [Pluteus cervinus]